MRPGKMALAAAQYERDDDIKNATTMRGGHHVIDSAPTGVLGRGRAIEPAIDESDAAEEMVFSWAQMVGALKTLAQYDFVDKDDPLRATIPAGK